MEKLLKNELFRSFILSIVIFAVLMVGTATSVINSYWQGVLILCGINIILAVSLNLAAGYLGQLTLGHAGFMSVGAYTSALISIYLNLPFIVSLLIGAIAAGIIGLIIGIPVLRLKGDYLCIITLAFNEIIRVIMNNLEITNGAKGLIGIPLNTNLVYVFIAMIITIFVVYSIVKSRHGRAIISIREDETASELSGIDVGYYKVFAFAVSAIFAGLAGGLYAHYYTVILPKGFDFNKSVEILVMVVLGGMGNLKGSIIAAIVLTVIPELLISFSQYRMLLYAIVLIAAMILKGTGKGEQIMERLLFFKKKDEVKPE
ncbi:branched-chain amino acid ABC transporter permease [Catenibacterium sp.]|uniref:branched-chain amino acid ABC transporter permease n=1 Tax=Catenibacterium sp. TaxID=2049022 RepID=UPI003079FDC3